MGNDDGTARLPPVSESLRDRFKEDVEERFGTVRGHYRSEVENALREYLEGSHGGDTHDRLRRIEERLDAIEDNTRPTPDAETGKNKKDRDVSQRTKNRLESIETQIQRESGKGPVHEAVVKQAIEDNAGHSDPTIRRYREMLVEREIIHPHPNHDSKFVYGDGEFVGMVQNLAENGAIPNDRYWDYVERLGQDRWHDVLDRIDYDHERDSGIPERGVH